MKVAFLVRCAPPVINGVGDYTFHLALALRKAGVEARIFTAADQQVDPAAVDWIHPVVTRWRGDDVARAVSTIFSPEWCSFQYVPQMYGRAGFCPDAVAIPVFLRRTCHFKIAVTLHEIILGKSAGLKNSILDGVMRYQARRLMAGADRIISTCSSYQRVLEHLSGKGAQVFKIPVGSNIPVMDQDDQSRGDLETKYGLNGAKKIGFFGRLAETRDQILLLRLLQRAEEKGIRAFLLLIGAVQASNPLMFKALMHTAKAWGLERRLVVTGALNPEEVSRHLQLLDLFVFPQTDGLSTKSCSLITALAHGLPIAAYRSEIGDFDPTLIPHGIFPAPGDSEGLLAGVLDWLQKNSIGPSERRRTAAVFERHFSWKRIAEQYLEALN